MAFYFALFNVSSVNQELRGQRKAQKRERRRHSLATSSHIAKDYRLLPKPKIIFHDTNTDNETVSTLLDESTGDEISEHNSINLLGAEDSLKQRRASSPNSMDMALNNDLGDVERRLKRVNFNSPPTNHNEHSNGGLAEDQVWIKRALSPPSNHNLTFDDHPWVYSVDLEKKKHSDKVMNRPQLPERQRPTMGVSSLEFRSGSGQKDDKNPLRDNLRRHVNTWPEIRTNRVRWRPTLLLRRHSGGNLSDSERLVGIFQKRKGNGSQIPYQSIQSPLSPPQDPVTQMNLSRSFYNEPSESNASNGSTKQVDKKATKANTSQLPPKPTKSIVIVPTGKPSIPSSNTSHTNPNSWAQHYRPRSNESNVPFVRLTNGDNSKNMMRSSVF